MESEAQRGHSPQACANGWSKTWPRQSRDGSRDALAWGGSPDKEPFPTQVQQRWQPGSPSCSRQGPSRDWGGSGVSAVCGTPGAAAEAGEGLCAPSPCQGHVCHPAGGAGKPGPMAIQWDNRWPIVARPNLAAQAGNEQSEHTSAGAKAGDESALHPPWHRGQDGHGHLLSPQTPWQQPRAWGGASNGDFLCFV